MKRVVIILSILLYPTFAQGEEAEGKPKLDFEIKGYMELDFSAHDLRLRVGKFNIGIGQFADKHKPGQLLGGIRPESERLAILVFLSRQLGRLAGILWTPRFSWVPNRQIPIVGRYGLFKECPLGL